VRARCRARGHVRVLKAWKPTVQNPDRRWLRNEMHNGVRTLHMAVLRASRDGSSKRVELRRSRASLDDVVDREGHRRNRRLASIPRTVTHILAVGSSGGARCRIGEGAVAEGDPIGDTRPVSWSVYVARCSDGSLYCGIARDVAARLAEHDAGTGAKYTRGRGPLVVVLTRRCRTKSNALRLEYAIKQLSRAQKEALVSAPQRIAAIARQAYA
jgi:putative endonuclease